jgi:hypothetical protein
LFSSSQYTPRPFWVCRCPIARKRGCASRRPRILLDEPGGLQKASRRVGTRQSETYASEEPQG